MNRATLTFLVLLAVALPLSLIARDDWVRGVNPSLPWRTLAQLWQLQFHCGKPPPAEAPKILIIIYSFFFVRALNAEKRNGGRSDDRRACRVAQRASASKRRVR